MERWTWSSSADKSPGRNDELREEIGAIQRGSSSSKDWPESSTSSSASPGRVHGQPPGIHPRTDVHASRPVDPVEALEPDDVKVTVWWQTSFVPPDPKAFAPASTTSLLAAIASA
jgi:hypothetical protein